MRFNLRVYALIIHNQYVLLARETLREHSFTKFPGGGLEFGEGLGDGLKRELMEEIGIDIPSYELFYVNDFYQQSAFRETDQLISVYYKVTPDETTLEQIAGKIKAGIFAITETQQIAFEWVALEKLSPAMLTFPVDKVVAEMLTS